MLPITAQRAARTARRDPGDKGAQAAGQLSEPPQAQAAVRAQAAGPALRCRTTCRCWGAAASGMPARLCTAAAAAEEAARGEHAALGRLRSSGGSLAGSLASE